MPEPSVAGQVPQTEVADTPQSADKPRTDAGDPKDLMSFLDIPADVQGQLKPREALVELPGDIPTPPGEPEVSPPAQEQPSRDEEAEETEEETQEEEQEQQPAVQAEAPKLDKRQKRINRLTRQKSEIQGKLDATFAQLEEARRQLSQVQGQQQQTAAGAIPASFGRLGWISSEQQLTQEYNKAQAVIDWCDANAEGATTGTGEDEKFIDAPTIAGWRREAEKLVITAPMRREELRQYGEAKGYFDGLVKQAWPELLDKSSQDYQIAEAIRQQYPTLRFLPQGDYLVGLLVEGARTLDARNAKATPNGQRQHRDIDERAFAPRVPISPHVANPPSRPATPSSRQRLNEAMSNLVKDVDGSSTSLAATFAALDAARPSQRPSGHTPVKS